MLTERPLWADSFSWLVIVAICRGREVSGRCPGPCLCSGAPHWPGPPPGQLSAPLSLPGRLHALALIDKNLILPPWPYKAWFPSPESLAGPLTFLISCSCLLLWCCFGRGQGGHGEWKHLAGWTVSAPSLVSLQALALACLACGLSLRVLQRTAYRCTVGQ